MKDPERCRVALGERRRLSMPVDFCLRGLTRGKAGLGSRCLDEDAVWLEGAAGAVAIVAFVELSPLLDILPPL